MASVTNLVRQAGVVPVREGQVCLVTTRGGKRWVVPKGHIEPGKSACEIALQEAWEEAGLAGIIRHDPLGSYFYPKDGQVCHVIVFQLDVTGQSDTYPEMSLRQRTWLSVQQALARIDDEGLRVILREAAVPVAG